MAVESTTAVACRMPATARTGWHLARAAWAVTAVFALSNSPTPLYVYWKARIGFSSGTLTVIFAAYIAGLVLALLIAGRAADRYGRQRVVVPGIVTALASAALFIAASSVATLVIARFLTGLSVGVMVSAGMAAVVDLGGEHRRQASSTLASIAMVSGAGLGPLLAGVIYQATPGPVPWVFSINIALLALALISYPGLPLHRPSRASVGMLWPKLPAVPSQNRTDVASGIGVFAPGLTATSFVLSLGPSLLVLVARTTSPLLAGGAACIMFLAATVSQLALTRLGVRRLFAAGAASTVAAMLAVILTVVTASPVLFVCAAILAGCGQGLGQLGGLRLIAHHVPDARRAEANAVLNIGAYLPAAVLTVATGYTVAATGMSAAAVSLAVLLGSSALTAGTLAYRAARR
jgi:MFS family permease